MNVIKNPVSLKDHLSQDKKTAVLFTLSSCPFCRAFRPIFDDFSKKRISDFEYLEAVLDDFNNPLWDEYEINVVPTVIVFEKGGIFRRFDGRSGEGLSSRDLAAL
ncbi:MAG: thioredoxin family protein [Candidatus Aureabacteria bacterium]|nr:thioredoxin family protein [Candidatus Auribacterota bacterium]